MDKYPERALDEIQIAPSLLKGCNLPELGLVGCLAMGETLWLTATAMGTFPVPTYLAIMFALGFFIYRVLKKAEALGSLKRELPGELAYIYLRRVFTSYTTVPIIVATIVVGGVFFLFIPLILAVVDFGTFGLLVAPIASKYVIRYLTNNVDTFYPSAQQSRTDDLLVADTIFSTNKY